MNGPAHFTKAEQHLEAADAIETDGADDSMSAWHQRQAGVHAALALTAAMARPLFGDDAGARQEWKRVIS